MHPKAGERVVVVGDQTYLKGKTGVIVDEGYTFGTGTTVLIDGEEESMFFSFMELERIGSA